VGGGRNLTHFVPSPQEIHRLLWNPKAHSRSQKLATILHPEIVPSSQYHHTLFFKIHFNIILRSTPISPKWFLPFKGKGKAVPVPFLTEHHAMKAYWGVEVQFHAFFDLGTR
jgi:hypothetical protein